MDILQLVDRLEDLFNESRPIPLTNNVIVDEDRMLDIIDQLRVAIPDEVKKAQKLISERERTMAQAQEEAKRTLQLAREKSEGLVDRDAIVSSAEARAEQVHAQALVEAGCVPYKTGKVWARQVQGFTAYSGLLGRIKRELDPHGIL